MRYLYEGHLGELYVSSEIIEDTYCETCGDSDWLMGDFETIKDFWELVEDGDYSLQYIYPIMISLFDLPDDARYQSDYERDEGICCNSNEEIMEKIKEAM